MSAEHDVERLGEGDGEDSTYQPPPSKTIEEILATDQEDESLRKYKEALLGAAQTETIVVGELFIIYVFLNKNIVCVCVCCKI